MNEMLGALIILFNDFNNLAIVHAGNAVCVRKDTVVMCDDDHGAVRRARDFAEKIEHDLAVARIQCGGGFVTNDQWRLMDQGAGDGNALLLAAGEFVGALFPTVPEADLLKNFTRALDGDAVGISLNQQRHAHVFGNGKRGDEIELLENKTDVLGAEVRERAVRHFFKRTAKDMDGAAFNFQSSGDGAEQSGFPTAGWPDKHHDFSRVSLQAYLFEDMDAVRPLAETFFERADVNDDTG